MVEQPLPDYCDLLRLDGLAFVVLGAGQGIGEQTCSALSQCGASVLCVDIDAERAEHVAGAVGGSACTADVTIRADARRLFRQADALFGKCFVGVVDVVGMPVGGALASLDDADWDRQFDLVLRHALFAIQCGAPLLAQRGGGSMVFVGSMAGIDARSGTLLGYSSAKAALHHLVRCAAQEFASQQVRFNVVAPGLTQTPRLLEANDLAFWDEQRQRIPLGRVASTSDIASAILFFASPASRHITGTVLPVDGGTSLGVAAPRAIARSLPVGGSPT